LKSPDHETLMGIISNSYTNHRIMEFCFPSKINFLLEETPIISPQSYSYTPTIDGSSWNFDGNRGINKLCDNVCVFVGVKSNKRKGKIDHFYGL
jgi:hypothetical protein